jgi:hypothetical protein
VSSLSVASLPKNSYCTTALWVKSQERALGIVGTTVLSLFPLLPQLSLWCAGGNLSLLSLFFFFSVLFAEVAANQARPHT